MVEEIKHVYDAIREDPASNFSAIYNQAMRMATSIDVTPQKPRVAGRSTQRANAPSESVEEHYIRNVFIPFLDNIIAELETRWMDGWIVGVLRHFARDAIFQTCSNLG